MFWKKNKQKPNHALLETEKVPDALPVDPVQYSQLLFYDTGKQNGKKGISHDISTAPFIGQDRAIKAIESGLHLKGDGFNIFVTGVAGTGKMALVKKLVTEYAMTQPVPPDVCYVCNFYDEFHPHVLLLPPGTGLQLKNDCEDLTGILINEAKYFLEDEVSIECLESLYFSVSKIPDSALHEFRTGMEDDFITPDTLNHLENILRSIETLQKKYQTINKLEQYFENLKGDFYNQLLKLKKYCNSMVRWIKLKSVMSRYSVNLLVNNSGKTGAPVIFENIPSVKSLCGYREYTCINGTIATDHRMIIPGAMLRANGGYLIMEIEEILGDTEAWDCLKKCIKHKQLNFDSKNDSLSNLKIRAVEPEAVQVHFKVILTGDPEIFQTLFCIDDEFPELFKVRAEVSEMLIRTADVEEKFELLMQKICSERRFKTCTADAVKNVLNHFSRKVNHREKISAKFSEIGDILEEADLIASAENKPEIDGMHIRMASYERYFRSRAAEDAIVELIKNNILYIDTEGFVTGQINGVSVIDMGEYAFGRPVRITAKTFVGAGNIINIEREADLSGSIHSKGVLILCGYLGQTYAQDKPLALNASICFEQCYEEIDGDSASSAELYCLLSSLSGVALRQDIAVTGSIDQSGRIQSVGGINQKIEGFFNVCMIRGLTGTQGILIPQSNMCNLVLKDECIEAVKNKKFHIYPVSTIEEGLRVLTGRDPGVPGDDGTFNRGTIHFMVNQKLRSFASVNACYEKEDHLY